MSPFGNTRALRVKINVYKCLYGVYDVVSWFFNRNSKKNICLPARGPAQGVHGPKKPDFLPKISQKLSQK